MRVVGLISGTSTDGIDAAVADLEISADVIELRPLGSTTVPYEPALRDALAAVLPPATTTAEELCRLDTLIGRAFADAARLALANLASGTADLVASHGQTIYHWVDAGGRVLGTLQVGQPAWIAEATGLPVVADLRPRDVASGGQGAPLASVLDALLLADSDRIRAALNLGGIANVTIVAPDAEPMAFDTGPANALIDAAMTHITNGAAAFDRDGAVAARGRVVDSLLDRLLADPYYEKPPPKSTGKEHFHLPYLLGHMAETGAVAPDDLVATVTALTARTVADACRRHDVAEVVVSGGGVANPVLMGMLTRDLGEVTITPIDDFGISADAKEAYLFSLLGFLTVHGLPGNVPSATGASHPAVLGCVLPGRSGFLCPPRPAAAPTRLHVLG
ncbi:MAG: anhydro-N-acetylmuramic acid kinase [Acidimicrobiales bacterium]